MPLQCMALDRVRWRVPVAVLQEVVAVLQEVVLHKTRCRTIPE
jgi:hypothetical protein